MSYYNGKDFRIEEIETSRLIRLALDPTEQNKAELRQWYNDRGLITPALLDRAGQTPTSKRSGALEEAIRQDKAQGNAGDHIAPSTAA